MTRSVLSRSFTLSLLLHAGLVGLLFLVASRPPVFSDTPLRVRILAPPVVAPPATGRIPGTSREPRAESREGGETSAERRAPSPERPAPSAERHEEPRVAARPTPEPPAPRTERIPETPREAPALAPPDQSGLSLRGPAQAAPRLPAVKGGTPGSGLARPSLRDQIASLGSGLTGDLDGAAKRTISLDSREEHFVDYLGRLKRRVQRVWEYPEEAVKHGIGGELFIVFTLNKAGSLTYIRLVRSSGFPILDEEALRAVKLAAPFDSFSPEMGDEPLNISASFHYDLPRRFRRN